MRILDRSFVSYLADLPPKPRAIREAMKALHEGYPKRWLLGSLESKWTTSSGDPVVTILTTTRYNEDMPEAEGHYRTINPHLGSILVLEVVEQVNTQFGQVEEVITHDGL